MDSETIVLSHEENGSGVPVVLLHGFPFDHSIWREQLTQPGIEGARLLAPDLPGFGGSGPLATASPGMDDYAEWVAQWAGRLGLGRFVLVGHSMGGYIAFAFARKHPEMLLGLGLVCTRPGPDSEQAREGRYAQAAGVQERGAQVVADAMLPRLFSPRTQKERPEIPAFVSEVIMRQQAGGIVAALRAMASRPDSTPALKEISVPTLVVAGADDAIIPRPDADLMARRIRGAHKRTVRGAGHMPMLEQPGRLNALLGEFVRGLRPPEG